MNKSIRWIPFLLAAAAASAGCQARDRAAADSNTGAPMAMTANQAKASVSDITIGHQAAADGSIAADQKGNNFSAGQPVIIAMKIGKAPVGTPVAVDWYGPNNQELANDQKAIDRGQSNVNFASKDTTAWGQGDYHADVSVGGQKVDTERFSIVAPDKGDSTATKPSDVVSDVSVGHQLGADGSIAADQTGKNFMPGQPVFVAFRAGTAPAGTNVEIDWYGPDNQKLGTDQKQVASGASMMHFSTMQTSGWGLGDYHADLLVNGQKADTEHFSIVNAKKADKQGR